MSEGVELVVRCTTSSNYTGWNVLSYEARLRVEGCPSQRKVSGKTLLWFSNVSKRKIKTFLARPIATGQQKIGLNWKEVGLDFTCWSDNFTMRVVRHCNTLPREVVYYLTLRVFEVKLHGALSNLILWSWWEGGLDDVQRSLKSQIILWSYPYLFTALWILPEEGHKSNRKLT